MLKLLRRARKLRPILWIQQTAVCLSLTRCSRRWRTAVSHCPAPVWSHVRSEVAPWLEAWMLTRVQHIVIILIRTGDSVAVDMLLQLTTCVIVTTMASRLLPALSRSCSVPFQVPINQTTFSLKDIHELMFYIRFWLCLFFFSAFNQNCWFADLALCSQVTFIIMRSTALLYIIKTFVVENGVCQISHGTHTVYTCVQEPASLSHLWDHFVFDGKPNGCETAGGWRAFNLARSCCLNCDT